MDNDKNQVIWSWKDLIVYTTTKIRSNGLEKESIEYTMQKSGQMVLKGFNCVHSD